MRLLATAAFFSLLFAVSSELAALGADEPMCESMCSANFSDVIEECQFGCEHRGALNEGVNPFEVCQTECEHRLSSNILEKENATEWVTRAWDACLAACQLPYKTKIRWNVYIDLRSGEPIWNFERIVNDGHQMVSFGMGYEDLINTVNFQDLDVFLDPNSKLHFNNPFGRLNGHETDARMLQNVMVEMLNRVRSEMSRLAPTRFDGISSIDYIGPRLVEHGPHGPRVTDITEFQYRPKEVLIYNSHHRHDRAVIIYFLLFAFVCTMLFALIHLRRYHETIRNIRMRRAAMARQNLIENDLENGTMWAKKLPSGSAPPSYSSPEDK